MTVVKHALTLPANARIKPTCRRYPPLKPASLRTWIQQLAPPPEGTGARVSTAPAQVSPAGTVAAGVAEQTDSEPPSTAGAAEAAGTVGTAGASSTVAEQTEAEPPPPPLAPSQPPSESPCEEAVSLVME